jgi:hypothetical protein
MSVLVFATGNGLFLSLLVLPICYLLFLPISYTRSIVFFPNHSTVAMYIPELVVQIADEHEVVSQKTIRQP